MKIVNSLILITFIMFSLSSNGMQSIKKDWLIGGFGCVAGAAGVLNIAHQIYTKNYDAHRIFASTVLLSTGLASAAYLMWSKSFSQRNEYGQRFQEKKIILKKFIIDSSYEEIREIVSSDFYRRYSFAGYKLIQKNEDPNAYIKKQGQTVYIDIKLPTEQIQYDISDLKEGTYYLFYNTNTLELVEKETKKVLREKKDKV